MSVRAAALLVVLGIAYHGAMLASILTHDDEAPTILDRIHPLSSRKGTYGEDAHGVYQAGRNVLDGRSMYDLKGAERVHERVVFYSYHSNLGLFYALVNLVLSVQGAHVAGVLVQEALLVLMALLTAASLGLPRAERLALLGMYLCFTPLYPEHFIGQFNIMTGAIFTAVVLADAAGRSRGAGALWSLSITLKPSLVFLGALYLRQGRILRLVLCGLFVAGTGAAYLFVQPGSFVRSQGVFTHGMARNSADSLGFYGFVLDLLMRSGVPGFTAIDVTRVVTMGLAGAAVAVMFLDRELDATWWACTLALTYGLGSHMFWEQSYVFLLPPLGILAFKYRLRAAAIVWAILALPTPFALLRFLDRDYVRPYGAASRGFRWDALVMGMVHHGAKALPLLVLWCLLLASRRGRLGLPWRST